MGKDARLRRDLRESLVELALVANVRQSGACTLEGRRGGGEVEPRWCQLYDAEVAGEGSDRVPSLRLPLGTPMTRRIASASDQSADEGERMPKLEMMRARSLIPACDVGLERFEEIVAQTADLAEVGRTRSARSLGLGMDCLQSLQPRGNIRISL